MEKKFDIGDTIYASGVLSGVSFAFKVNNIKFVEGIPLLYGTTLATNTPVYAVHPKFCEKVNFIETVTQSPFPNKPIISDGKSSSYYDLKLSQKTIDFIVENGYVKTEHLIHDIFYNDFDAGTAFKSLVRAWGTINGSGKQGNSLQYELNKIDYSVNKIREYRGEE
jgi:hypothetical protein